ncbi:MAG: hypothetical protein J6V01_04175 [Clostridia bacterium]|nr:hypothetical protein [Clostridia bacterium]
MKKQPMKILLVALALSMILPLAAGCGNAASESGDTTVPAVTLPENGGTSGEAETDAATAAVPDLPDRNWERDFRVLGCGDTGSDSFPTFEIFAEDLTGEAMNDAVYTRNETVSRKYGIGVVQTLVKDTSARITSDWNSHEDSFDLVFADISKVGGLARRGMFNDLTKVDYIDFSKPYWYSDVNGIVSIKGRIYYTSSDYSLRDKNRVQCMVCNDALRVDRQLESVPELVRNYEWTAEKMFEFVSAATFDVNGDGVRTSDDSFGIALHAYHAFPAFCFGMGMRIVGKDDADGLVLVLNPDRDTEAVDRALKICGGEGAMFPEDYGRNWDINSDTFEAGRSLFSVNSIHFVSYYNRVCEFDFTVCPFPTYDSDQKAYYSIPDVRCMLFSIPVTCADPDFSGFALEAFSYESTATTCATFVELLCKARNVRNADSVEMINLLFDGIVYDGSLFYSDSIPLYNIIDQKIPQSKSNTYLRESNSLKKKAENEIAKINDAFGN